MTTPGREATPDVGQSFAAAWMECIEKHRATLTSGPCRECSVKHARAFRETHPAREKTP